MWILPKNHPLYSHYAQDMVASKEDLSLQGLNIEHSLMWRSKPSQLKTWQRRWKTTSWMPRLFGRILKPSQQKSFEEKLISSQADILASRLVQQDNERVKKTLDTCGLTSENISEQLDLLESSLKMSKDTSRLDSPQLSATWKKMVTEQRGEYSARKKLAHPTDASASLSWATPNTLDHISVVRKPEERSEKAKKGGCSNLREQVHWPTPRATDSTGGAVLTEKTDSGFRSYRHDSKKWFGAKLKDAVICWPTPSARDHKGGSGTIVEEDGKFYRVSDTTQTRFGACLDAVVEHLEKNWPTPSAHEARLGYHDRSDPTKKGTQESLTTKVVNEAGGKGKCSTSLNPDWVEGLMGVPLGWSSLEGTSNDWQYGWHDGSWEEGIPRVIEGCPDRVDRIRLLGNAVVPQTAAKAWTVLQQKLVDTSDA